MSKIIWSKIDEAPALATYSLLPIVNAFTKAGGVDVVTSDISLAGRVLSAMDLAKDELSELGKVVLQEDGNIIKLPNISASVGQLKECIAELQGQGYDIPNYPENPANAEEEALQAKYSTCLGSAVNPVLREGNSDRRAAKAVKNFAQKNPHKLRAFPENAKSYVAHMAGDGDFFGNEKSVTLDNAQTVTIALNGKTLGTIDTIEKEIIDGTYMSVAKLKAFIQKTIDDARANGVLWSIHLKATMMKISDPIMFGHALEVFFAPVFAEFKDTFASLNVNANMGISDIEKKIAGHADEAAILAAFKAVVESDNPEIAMVDSDKGTTNFNASNDVIIDASMPVVVREGGKQWNRNGDAKECVAVIPDSTYAMFHAEMVEDCVKNGQYDVATMGSMANVGLMAQKAEEYGSHPTTFELAEAGTVTVTGADGVLMSFDCEAGDIWRLARVKDIPIKDWVRLAVERGQIEQVPVIFWLDAARAHDAEMIKKVNTYLKDLDTDGLDIQIMRVTDATRFTNARVRKGENTIAVTGNVLRDHLTDMYPILELGTSAKMLSIVPLLAGGGLYETGAGGSAPKHVDQFLAEGHLRWDSLGEFLALAESLRFIAKKQNSAELAAVTAALDVANDAYLDNNKEPGRKVGTPDNKASHFFVAQYWANALSSQTEVPALAAKFAPVAKALTENEETIIAELLAVEGKAQDIGGYFNPNDELAEKAMRPSATLNNIINNI